MAISSFGAGFSVPGAQDALNNLNRSLAHVTKSGVRLATGSRVVDAGDDVAALAAGTQFETRKAGLLASLGAIQRLDGALSEADKALSTVSELYQRQKSIATQANSGALSDNERAFLETEYQELGKETDRVIASTKFGGNKLFDTERFNNDKIIAAKGLGAFSLLDILAKPFREALDEYLKASY